MNCSRVVTYRLQTRGRQETRDTPRGEENTCTASRVGRHREMSRTTKRSLSVVLVALSLSLGACSKTESPGEAERPNKVGTLSSSPALPAVMNQHRLIEESLKRLTGSGTGPMTESETAEQLAKWVPRKEALTPEVYKEHIACFIRAKRIADLVVCNRVLPDHLLAPFEREARARAEAEADVKNKD